MIQKRQAVAGVLAAGAAFLLGGGTVCAAVPSTDAAKAAGPAVLRAEDYRPYAEYFNRMEDENIAKAVPNAKAWEWMEDNIPLFDCPQDNFREIYYFRWWSFRKHITDTPQGPVVTEFLVNRPYADKYNMIACAMGHHTYEMRWLHDPDYLTSYLKMWYTGNDGQPMSKLHGFSSWTPDAVYNAYLVNDDEGFVRYMYPLLKEDYFRWEREKRVADNLFWQRDVSDGMEESASGGRRVQNRRPTINSYMYGNAVALAKMAEMAGDREGKKLFEAKADTIRRAVQEHLWNPEDRFFETMNQDGTSSKVREAIGFIPWYFNLPDRGDRKYDEAWLQAGDPEGFDAPFGLTTCERRSPLFRTRGCCSCEWDGAVWPFATSQTLTAMANFLNNYPQQTITDSLYFKQMEKYVESQYYRGHPYVGEYLDEKTGYWLKGDQERSRYYNHSTFADLVISGLVGVRPQPGNKVEVNPLVPEGKWDWFCLDNLPYKGKTLTVVWDKTGEKYGRGKGLTVLVNGKTVGHADSLQKIVCKI